MALNQDAVEAALRDVIAELDYDLHKSIEQDESSGENTYHEVVGTFIRAYEAAVRK